MEKGGRSSRTPSAISHAQGQRGEILSQTSSSTNKKKLKAGMTDMVVQDLKLTKFLRFDTKQGSQGLMKLDLANAKNTNNKLFNFVTYFEII